MTLNFRPSALAGAAAAGVLAAGCALAGIGASQANAATDKPGVVSGFAVRNDSVTTDGATLTWDRDARATAYRVVIVNASTPAAAAAYDSDYTLTGTSVTVSRLSAGTAYEAKISAEDPAGASEWTQWVQFYTAAAQGSSGVISTKTYTFDPNGASIPTGGSFTAKAVVIGTVTLPGGTYLLNVNLMATPNAATSGAIFPQAFVYAGPANADFTNDLFNIGSGALAPYNASSPTDQVNSYYSGSSEITVPAGGQPLDVYAFGYDSDHGAGSYELNVATLTATALNVAAG